MNELITSSKSQEDDNHVLGKYVSLLTFGEISVIKIIVLLKILVH